MEDNALFTVRLTEVGCPHAPSTLESDHVIFRGKKKG